MLNRRDAKTQRKLSRQVLPSRRTLASVLCVFAALRFAVSPAIAQQPYAHRHEPIGTVRQLYDGALPFDLRVSTFRNIDRLFPTRRAAPSDNPRALPRAATLPGQVRFEFEGAEYTLDDYLDSNRVAAILVLKDGRIALERYRYGNTARTRWMSMSVAKSITSTLVGAALRQGHIASLDDAVTRYVPGLAGSAYDGVTVRQVLMMTSGVRWDETYTDPRSDRRRLLEAQIAQQPGGALNVMRALPRAAPPGTVNNYNTGETQIVAEVLRGATGRSLAAYLEDRIWKPAGMEAAAYWWLDAPGGVEIGGSGIAATLRDYARFGQFILDRGVVDGDTILPPGWVREATTPTALPDGTSLDYGYLWWPGTTPAARRDSAFSAEGIFGQFIYVNPAERVVIVVWSAWPQPSGGVTFGWDWAAFEAIVRSL